LLVKKKTPEPEHLTGTDRYLVTYADLITLLLGLFVLLYSASQMDEEKYKELSRAFGKYFQSSEKGALHGGKGVLQSKGAVIPGPLLPDREKKNIVQIRDETETVLSSYLKSGALSLKQNGSTIIITLPEKLLFSSGRAEIIENGRAVIDSLSAVLSSNTDNQITVDGHTDSEPVTAKGFVSNWQLSVNRALSVSTLMMQNGLPEHCFVIRGFGSQRPVADNSSLEGRASNRRVEITISELPSDAPSTEGYSRQSSENIVK
jgi:chemotaxis protein MotB